jgi:undecaprenyl-diphosphatase
VKKKGTMIRKHTLHILIVEIIFGVVVSLISLGLFAKLADGVFEKESFAFDQSIIHIVYSWRSPLMTEIMKAITIFGGVGLLATAVFIAFVFSAYRKNRRSITFLLIFVTGALLNLLLKGMFKRPRPTLMPLDHELSYSFPSGHAMNAFIFYMVIAYMFYHYTRDRALGIAIAVALGIWIFLIGLSRVYLGVHYPSDVIAGYFAGLWWLATVLVIEKLFMVEHLIEKRKT